MLEKKYEEYTLCGGKKGISVVFKEKKYEWITQFLLTTVSECENWVKEQFDKVISGESNYEEADGESCCAEISPSTTKIYYSLSEYDTIPEKETWCEVDTKELRQLIDEWCEKVREYKNEHRN